MELALSFNKQMQHPIKKLTNIHKDCSHCIVHFKLLVNIHVKSSNKQLLILFFHSFLFSTLSKTTNQLLNKQVRKMNGLFLTKY